MENEKITIAVIYGGVSSEHEIALRSATTVISELDRDIFDVVAIGIDRDGNWWLNPIADVDPLAGKTLQVQSQHAEIIFPLEFFAEQQCVAFPVLHGPMGEDGTIQGLFEMADTCYVGAGVLSSAVCMDKDIAKRLLLEQQLPVTPYIAVRLGEWQTGQQYIVETVIDSLGESVFVKPANLGSSIGCSKVKTKAELVAAIELAFKFDTKILLERTVENAREIECAVLENIEYGEGPLAAVPGELITTHEFYDYSGKYQDDNLSLIIPAKIDAQLTEKIQDLACQAFEVLQCQGMGRVDFLIDPKTKEVFIGELNTIPGFTDVSMYPMMWQASGLEYKDLLTTLIHLAIARYQRRQQLKRDL